MSGRKDRKDVELSWIYPPALEELGRVAYHGAEKYGDGYNYLGGFDWSLSYNAAQRHLMKFWAGDDTDTESGYSHLAHAAWHCLALLAFVQRDVGDDDRPTPPSSGGAASPVPDNVIRDVPWGRRPKAAA